MTQYSVVIGVDPGATTGIAIYDLSEMRFQMHAHMQPRRAVQYLWSLLDDGVGVGSAVCVEKYDIEPGSTKMTRQYEALYVTGALLYKAEILGVEFQQYSRADAKNFATDKKVRALDGLTSSVHERDASRQVIVHLARAGRLPKLHLD